VREYTDSVEEEGFAPKRGDAAMGYHTRAQLPIAYALADQFAICDRWFCSVLGPTWPNRFFLHSAQSNGRINNAFPDDLVNGFTWPTIYDRLNAAGITWGAYWSDLSFLLLWGRLQPQVNASGASSSSSTTHAAGVYPRSARSSRPTSAPARTTTTRRPTSRAARPSCRA